MYVGRGGADARAFIVERAARPEAIPIPAASSAESPGPKPPSALAPPLASLALLSSLASSTAADAARYAVSHSPAGLGAVTALSGG